MVVDWFVLGAVGDCLPDSADNLHRMDSRGLRREHKPLAHLKHRDHIGERYSRGKPKAAQSRIDQAPRSKGVKPRLTSDVVGESEGISAITESGLQGGHRSGEWKAIRHGFHSGISSMIGGTSDR